MLKTNTSYNKDTCCTNRFLQALALYGLANAKAQLLELLDSKLDCIRDGFVKLSVDFIGGHGSIPTPSIAHGPGVIAAVVLFV